MLLGFAWIIWDAVSGFVADQHSIWMYHSQNLPEGDTISRSDAAIAMRDLSLNLKDRHRAIVFPACMMLLGGGLTFLGSGSKKKSHAATMTVEPTGTRLDG